MRAAEAPCLRDRLYPEPRARRRAVTGWCLYDFASSAYSTLISTVAFPIYFREVVVNATDNRADQLWGQANFIAMLSVALLSPVVGALADESGRKKTFLVFSTLVAVTGTALLSVVGTGDVWRAVGLYVLATVGFEIGYVFYNAFLPEVSTPRNIGTVSGWAWGVGYIGGLFSLVVCFPLLSSDLRSGTELVPEALRDRQWSFLVVAAYYLLFSLPAFAWLRRSGGSTGMHGGVRASFARLGHTLRHLRSYRDTARFVLASLFFTDGITTIILFAGTYATVTLGFSASELLALFLVLNVVAFPGALLAGRLADRIGAKRTIVLCLFLWIAVVLVTFAATTKALFWVAASGAALGMGSTQAVGRSFMAQISPPEREAEFFGFYVLSGKFASIFGPLIFGTVSAWTGNQRWAVLSLLPLFLAGLALMYGIDEERARRHVGTNS